jgi:hypothetical protein
MPNSEESAQAALSTGTLEAAESLAKIIAQATA